MNRLIHTTVAALMLVSVVAATGAAAGVVTANVEQTEKTDTNADTTTNEPVNVVNQANNNSNTNILNNANAHVNENAASATATASSSGIEVGIGLGGDGPNFPS